MFFTRLSGDCVQQIADGLDSRDALSLSLSCRALRDIGLRSALRSYGPRKFNPPKFVAFVKFFLSGPRNGFASSLRSLALRNYTLPQAVDEEWVRALIQLLEGVTLLRDLSLCHWDDLVKHYSALGTALRNSSSIGWIELRKIKSITGSLLDLPASLHTLCLTDVFTDYEGLHALLSAAASLPRLHTVELHRVRARHFEFDCFSDDPPVATTVRRFVLYSCELPFIVLVRAFPKVSHVAIWDSGDLYLADEGVDVVSSYADPRWGHLEDLFMNSSFAEPILDVVSSVRSLEVDFECSAWEASGEVPIAPVIESVDEHPWLGWLGPKHYADMIAVEENPERSIASAISALLPLHITRLDLRFVYRSPFSGEDDFHPVSTAAIENRPKTYHWPEGYVATLLGAAKALHELEWIGVSVSRDVGVKVQRQWRLQNGELRETTDRQDDGLRWRPKGKLEELDESM
ncbi:uncharacterized protein LAESUDRAFT_812038 [Laetiporus sulphureus 93-53]|uniref:F-box domain-containing protein n=1 Tax=Laetiporus sulphureus 93-53 TaxID=1314785 RepID=A0A165EMC2_9APHY|nr:uncharacterized protein LAESUDRAFT_812038 [Laetiporus sulphureus 93-53]KZT07360.1 hypothetical protein LAESUDRAFT_812038 [Laetiporus sulphureus 93-53]